MADLIEEIEKGLKKVAQFLEITPAEEEYQRRVEDPLYHTKLHHSEPYNNPPKEHIGLIMTSRQPSQSEFEKPTRSNEEEKYLNRLESPLRVDGGLPVISYRYGIWGEKIYEP